MLNIDLDDFDFFEDYDDIKVGDIVRLKKNCDHFIKIVRRNKRVVVRSMYMISLFTHYNHTVKNTKISKNGIKLIKFDSPAWYHSTYWYKINKK